MEERQITTEEQTEQMKNENTQKEGQEKKFTQADVDRIVKERLRRQRTNGALETNNENAAKEKELSEKESDINLRENRLNCKEYLINNGMPVELLEIIDTSDSVSFKEKAQRAAKIMSGSRRQTAPLASTEPQMTDSAVHAAFKNPRHKVRHFPRRWED